LLKDTDYLVLKDTAYPLLEPWTERYCWSLV